MSRSTKVVVHDVVVHHEADMAIPSAACQSHILNSIGRDFEDWSSKNASRRQIEFSHARSGLCRRKSVDCLGGPLSNFTLPSMEWARAIL